MGVIVNLLEEIRNRIETATGSGKSLEDVKRVQIGYELEARKYKNLPIINISLKSGHIINEYMRGSASDSIVVDILMIYNKLAGAGANKQYKTSDQTGAIYYLEKILNAIENNTSGILDFDFAGNASRLRDYNYTIEERHEQMEIKISLELGTIQFLAGQR